MLALSSSFTGGVTSYANAGSAGGTFYYINLGGIKLLWGETNTFTAGNGFTTEAVDFPAGFFTTIQFANAPVEINSIGAGGSKMPYYQGISTSGMTVAYYNPETGTGDSINWFVFVIGT